MLLNLFVLAYAVSLPKLIIKFLVSKAFWNQVSSHCILNPYSYLFRCDSIQIGPKSRICLLFSNFGLEKLVLLICLHST